MDGQKDSEWEGEHQPPDLIRGGKKTSDPAVLMAPIFFFFPPQWRK